MRTLIAILLASIAGNAACAPPCAASLSFHERTFTIPFDGTGGGIFFTAKADGKEDLRVYFDSGASRTLLDAAAAKRMHVVATEHSSTKGAGSGKTELLVSHGHSIEFGGIAIRNLDFNVLDLTSVSKDLGRPVDALIGFDVLCGATTTIDFKQRQLTFTAPDAFTPPPGAEALPLEFVGRWSAVRAELKVRGQSAVADRFIVDTGSADAVDHPIILKSTGPVRHTRTGNGLGTPVDGAIGGNEWLRIGRFRIGPTQTVCCSGNPDDDRVIGNGILSRFVVTFDYPHDRLFLAEPH